MVEHGWAGNNPCWIYCKCGWAHFAYVFDSLNERALRKHLAEERDAAIASGRYPR